MLPGKIQERFSPVFFIMSKAENHGMEMSIIFPGYKSTGKVLI